MNLKRWIAGAASAATLAGLSFVAAGPATASAAGASTCPSGHWPASIVGRPSAAHLGETGMALWADSHGWHLRVSEAGKDRAVFTGTVTTDGVIKDVARHTEGGDVVLSVGAKTVAYRFTNYGGLDGIDFVVPCSSKVTFTVKMNGAAVPTGRIVIGAANTHPDANPFSITKTA